MITEDEAFWAGIAVATMMLGGGFSMLFLRALTGEGAVVLALGLMTMALTIQLRAKPKRYVEPWTPVESRAMNPTPPVESPIESQQTQIADFTQEPSPPQEETSQPAEQSQPEPAQPQQPEQVQEPPAQPETPTEQKEPEQPAPEKPQEEPIVIF